MTKKSNNQNSISAKKLRTRFLRKRGWIDSGEWWTHKRHPKHGYLFEGAWVKTMQEEGAEAAFEVAQEIYAEEAAEEAAAAQARR